MRRASHPFQLLGLIVTTPSADRLVNATRAWGRILMANLPRIPLAVDERKSNWTFENDRTNRIEALPGEGKARWAER